MWDIDNSSSVCTGILREERNPFGWKSIKKANEQQFR